mgnify:CR=1 FL=1
MDSVIRGAIIYFIMLVIIRISGRRTMAQATPFDFVLLLIIAETTQQALLGDDFSVTNAFLVILLTLTLVVWLATVLKELNLITSQGQGILLFFILACDTLILYRIRFEPSRAAADSSGKAA